MNVAELVVLLLECDQTAVVGFADGEPDENQHISAKELDHYVLEGTSLPTNPKAYPVVLLTKNGFWLAHGVTLEKQL